jgi:hypothetical protein
MRQNTANLRTGSGVQQTRGPDAEEPAEVVRNHEGGTRCWRWDALARTVASATGEWTHRRNRWRGGSRARPREVEPTPRGEQGVPGGAASAPKATPKVTGVVPRSSERSADFARHLEGRDREVQGRGGPSGTPKDRQVRTPLERICPPANPPATPKTRRTSRAPAPAECAARSPASCGSCPTLRRRSRAPLIL